MRLIDAEKLEAELHERLCNPRNLGQSAGIAAAIHLVQKQPTLEPKRGRERKMDDDFEVIKRIKDGRGLKPIYSQEEGQND